MKRNIILLFLIFSSSFALFSQDTTAIQKSNPIVYVDINLSLAEGSSSGFLGGISLNYQLKDDLLTFRVQQLIRLRNEGLSIIIPIFTTIEQIDEYAFLYGKRHIYSNSSISYSGGISYLERRKLVEQIDVLSYDYDKTIGFPFEFSFKWFKPKRERYRIYAIVPVGKPTSFGRSFGFKLTGNISKTTFVGLGISYGFGWHKKY
jgi:hypothetical protein